MFTRDIPCKWNPESVVDPRTKEVFTINSAWDYVRELLESDHPVEVIELSRPPGKKGYVLHVNMQDDASDLYIKLQLGRKLIGRSFHYSTSRD